MVTGAYFFVAYGTDGTTEVGYELLVTGDVTGDVAFAPDVRGESATVVWRGDALLGSKAESACAVGGAPSTIVAPSDGVSGSVTITAS